MKEKKIRRNRSPERRYDEGPKFLGGRIFLCFYNDGFWRCVREMFLPAAVVVVSLPRWYIQTNFDVQFTFD